MPHSDENDLASTSSTEANMDVTTSPSTETEAGSKAESSPATGETEKSAIDIVRDVVEKREQTEVASPAEGEDGGEKDPSPVESQAQDEDKDDKNVPFAKHPRWRQVIKERNELRGVATRYNNIVAFMDTHGVSAEEGADALILAGLLKSNPAEAWRRLKPIAQALLVAAGEVLPDDLQQRVQNGEMSHEAALEVSRSRATVQSLQNEQTFRQQQATRQQQIETQMSITTAAETWQQERLVRDPNFADKLPQIQREVLWLQREEGVPTTREGVVGMLNKAYRAVNASAPTAPPARPKPQARPNVTGQVAGQTRPANLTTLDIVRAKGKI